jgi:hypothetical protein
MDAATELDTDEQFFQQGEEGTYIGGPARGLSLAPVALELELEPLMDPERLARAGRFRRPVALFVTALGVLFLSAFALRRPAAEGYAVASEDSGLSAAVGSDIASPAASPATPEAPLPEPIIAPAVEPFIAQSASANVTATQPARAVQGPSPSNHPATTRASTLKPRPPAAVARTPSAMTPKALTTAQPSALQQTPRSMPAARFPDYKP